MDGLVDTEITNSTTEEENALNVLMISTAILGVAMVQLDLSPPSLRRRRCRLVMYAILSLTDSRLYVNMPECSSLARHYISIGKTQLISS